MSHFILWVFQPSFTTIICHVCQHKVVIGDAFIINASTDEELPYLVHQYLHQYIDGKII